MLWGVMSDIHSNLDALQRVLEAFAERKVQGYVCCGDTVGYGPSPNEVVETLAGLKPLQVVMGNHDLAVLGRMDIEWFNQYAQAAAIWTRWKLSPRSAQFLESLPLRVENAKFTIVHGSPRDPAEEYLLTAQQFLDNLKHFKVSPCFVGHSHLTWCFSVDPKSPLGVKSVILKDGQSLTAEPGVPCVFNAGSVGQPRDHDPRASCGVYDDETRRFDLIRVPYDIPAVQKKMVEVGLPEFLIARLSYGQ